MNRNSTSPNSSNQPRRIAGIVDKIVASIGISRSYHGWSIVSQWSEIVGPKIAEVARAEKFEDGILIVAVEDDAWRQELSMERGKILEKIHRLPHGRVVKSIRLIRGQKGNRE